jgi:RimJ/RimL family protein N-acetyltransferase
MGRRAVIVAGERVVLTAPERDEFVDRWRFWNDPLTAMLTGSPSMALGLHRRTMPPVSREQREALYEQHVARVVLCFDVRADGGDGRCVGEVRLGDLTWPRASAQLDVEILAPDDRRAGYGVDAAVLVCAYAFDGLGLHRMAWRFPVANAAAAAASERIPGARRVGVERRAEWVAGGLGDAAVWELLREDFPPHPATAELRTPPGGEAPAGP